MAKLGGFNICWLSKTPSRGPKLHSVLHAWRFFSTKVEKWDSFCQVWKYDKEILLLVSTHLKNISQNGNLPQIGMKINNFWNHHPEIQQSKHPIAAIYVEQQQLDNNE